MLASLDRQYFICAYNNDDMCEQAFLSVLGRQRSLLITEFFSLVAVALPMNLMAEKLKWWLRALLEVDHGCVKMVWRACVVRC